MPLSGGTKLGPYEILAPIGAGGMGEVYRARDTKLEREVAIKVLPSALAQESERLARFEREAKVLASLNHPNIAQIYGIEDRALVMELVDGETLQGPLPLETALNYARQIADALEAAHEKGIIHRDLKPANIMITPSGVVKVLDFGLAALPNRDREGADPVNSPTLTISPTLAGMILGTAAYMSPEQARGKPVDKRADIWAFGVVLFEMLTGKPLFEGETVSDTLAQVLTKQPDWEQVPAKVGRLLKKCLEKDPKKRLRDVGDAWELLDDAPATTASSRSRLGMVPAAVPVVFAVALAALAFVHFREQPPPPPEPARFQIPLPDKATPAAFPNPTISPDGRRVVFPAVTEGVARLWVRALDQLDPRPLTGTEGVVGVQFWSPDSRFIAFGAQEKLKKVDPSGGPPQSLCSLPGVLLGGFWTTDGRIVFGTLTTGLFQVPAVGGAVSPLTVLDPKLGEISHGFPVPLPDGRHFLYRRGAASGESSGIFLETLEAGTGNPGHERPAPKRLLADASSLAFAPPLNPRAPRDGYLLFSREGTLMAQPFDSVRLELSGDAVPLAEQVAGNGDFSVSSTGVLVYATTVGAGGERKLTWYDRQGKSLGTVGAPGLINELALSPDGTRVASVRTTSGQPGTWIDEFARGVSNRITPPDASDRPVWSPDGSRLVFESASSIFLKAASNAGNEEVLFKFERPTDPLDWSRDGRWLLYQQTDPKTKYDLWALPMEPGKPPGKPLVYLQTASNEREGRFSPDGHFVAYLSDESGRYEVYVASFPEPSLRVPISNGGGYQPRWRRDGKELLYVTPEGKLMSVDVTLGGTFKAGAPKVLFRARIYGGGSSRQRWDVTPDGQRFLIIAVGGDASARLTLVENWAALLRK